MQLTGRSIAKNVVANSNKIVSLFASTQAAAAASRSFGALRDNLRATPFKLESLIGWTAAILLLVLAVKIFE